MRIEFTTPLGEVRDAKVTTILSIYVQNSQNEISVLKYRSQDEAEKALIALGCKDIQWVEEEGDNIT